MAKANFEISIELKELKIHVKGDREIVPEIATNVANQISGMIQPAGLIEGAKESHNGQPLQIDATSSSASRKTRKRTGGKPVAVGASGATVDWVHDANKWGTPLQTWS